MKNDYKKNALILITVMASLVWQGCCMETPKDESSNGLASQLSGLLRGIGQLFYPENPPSLSYSSSLSSLYEQYNNNGNLRINAPIKLQELYEKHKACLDESLTLGSFDSSPEIKMIEEFIKKDTIDYKNDNLLIKNLLPDSSDYKDCISIPLENSGYSGSDIFIIKEKTGNSVLGVVKTFVCLTEKDLKNKCLELSASLIALGLNPHPEKIRMARIQSAGYQRTNKSCQFGMLMEHAEGESIKEHVQQCLKESNLSGFEDILRHTAQYLSYFHMKSSEKFNQQKCDPTFLKKKREQRKDKFFTKIKFLGNQIFSEEEPLFNFQKALESELMRGGAGTSEISDNIESYLSSLCDKFIQSTAPIDWTITHGDAHVGNLFYETKSVPCDEQIDPALRFITMIDFDTMKETYGATGDPAEDVGRFLGSLWEEGAIYCVPSTEVQDITSTEVQVRNYWFIMQFFPLYNMYNIKKCILFQCWSLKKLFEEELKKKIVTTYDKISIWQNVFVDTYVKKTIELKKSTHSDKQPATIVQNLELYKLCLYKTIFTNPKVTFHTKQFLLYFFLREANIISK